MTLDRIVLLFAGVMTLAGVALTLWASPHFIWFLAFIGANLIQSAFTGICPAARAFKAMGFREGAAFR